MRTRSTTIIAAGVVVAVLGALTVVAYARSVQRSSTNGPSVTAFTAGQAIAAGTKGEEASKVIKRISAPRSLVPQGAITDQGAIVGRIAVRPISVGEVITSTQFGQTMAASGAASAAGLQIPPGKDAVTLSLPVPQGVARFVQPGDLVNIFVTFKAGPSSPDGKAITKILLSNVQVLANAPAGVVASRVGAADTGDVLLTLALEPPHVEKLVFSKENGDLWFALVRPGDGPASTSGQTFSTVLR